MPDTPHFKVPVHFNGKNFDMVEQDSAAEVAQCVEAALRTELGQRDEMPEFGVPDPAFRQGGVDLEALRHYISESEPRADATFDEELDDLIDTVIINLTGGAPNA